MCEPKHELQKGYEEAGDQDRDVLGYVTLQAPTWESPAGFTVRRPEVSRSGVAHFAGAASESKQTRRRNDVQALTM